MKCNLTGNVQIKFKSDTHIQFDIEIKITTKYQSTAIAVFT